jgi:hypothetical protein
MIELADLSTMGRRRCLKPSRHQDGHQGRARRQESFPTTPKLLRPPKKDDVPPPRERYKIKHVAEVH